MAGLFLVSAIAGCTSGASVGSAPLARQTVAPVASASDVAASATPKAATASPTATPTTAASTSSPAPVASPSPTPTATGYTLSGVTTCTAADEAIPGTYTTLDTNGNVVGSTYTEDASAISSYLVYSYASAPPTITPTAAPSEEPFPTPAPNAPTEMITIYVGEYSIPAFVGVAFPAVYQAQATTGCFDLVLEQPAGGTAGQARRREAAGSDNTFGVGELANPDSSVTKTSVDAEALDSLTITNLTATTGTGTFALSNGTNGTLTITGSGTVVAAQASTTDRARNPAYLRLKRLLERR